MAKPTPAKAARKQSPARVTRDAALTAAYIEELLAQQQALLERNELKEAKKAYETNSPFYGVPRAVLAASDEEAEVLIEWYQEKYKYKHGVCTGKCHQIVRSY